MLPTWILANIRFLKNVETDVKNLVNASFDDAKAEAYINEFNSNPDLDEKK